MKNESNTENITILGMSVNEFNNQYVKQFSIVKGGELLKGFWLALDSNGKECGMFSLSEKNELRETIYSSGEYGFIKRLQSMGTATELKIGKETADNNSNDEDKSKTETSPFYLFKPENSSWKLNVNIKGNITIIPPYTSLYLKRIMQYSHVKWADDSWSENATAFGHEVHCLSIEFLNSDCARQFCKLNNIDYKLIKDGVSFKNKSKYGKVTGELILLPLLKAESAPERIYLALGLKQNRIEENLPIDSPGF